MPASLAFGSHAVLLLIDASKMSSKSVQRVFITLSRGDRLVPWRCQALPGSIIFTAEWNRKSKLIRTLLAGNLVILVLVRERKRLASKEMPRVVTRGSDVK